MANELDAAIIRELSSPDPPKTIRGLATRCKATLAYTYNQVRSLLRSGAIKPEQCPWRRDRHYESTSKMRAGPLADLEKQLESIINENNRDRVQAIKELRELRTSGGSFAGPPPPDDRKGMVLALARMLRSAGRDATNEAIQEAWPPDEQETPEADLEGSPIGGDQLD